NIKDIEIEFLSNKNMFDVDKIYFTELLRGISINVCELDKRIAPYLSRKFTEIDQVEKAVLRLAMFEFCYRDDIPYKVIINEAIELAKIFGAEESHKFINGALDKVASIIKKNHNLQVF
ncbi:MAG: transcription antitermination factor NusB, partial [Arsenophonus sp. ET-DL12-MAG3]